jgi:hypothetical protein
MNFNKVSSRLLSTLPATWAYCGGFWIGREAQNSIVSQDSIKYKHVQNSLAEEFIHLLPSRPPCSLLPLLCHQVREIQVSPSRMQIHVPTPHNLRLVPDLVANIKGDDNRRRKIGLEKAIDSRGSRLILVPYRSKPCPELCGKNKSIKNQPRPRSDNTSLGSEGQLIKTVALYTPSFPKPDMCQADRAPGKDRGEASNSNQPVEGDLLLVGRRHVSDKAE